MAKTVEVGHKYHAGPPHGSLRATVKVLSTDEVVAHLDRKANAVLDEATDDTVEFKGVKVEVLTSDWPLYEAGTTAVMRTRFIKDEIVESFEVPMPTAPVSA